MGSPRFRAEHSDKSLESYSFDSGHPPILDSASATDASTDPPPDGGTLAWLQVAASFFVFMNTWGIVNTFGAYQNFYEVNILRSHSPSAISWIGSVQGFLLLLVGALTGPLFDAGHIRTLVGVGSLLVVLSMVATSLVEQYYHAFLAQGVCFGIGAGMLFVPSVAVVSTYFDEHRSFAVGVAASGSSLGGVIYPIMFHQLQPRIGFGWATRVIGLIVSVTLAFSNLVVRQRVLPTTRRKLFDISALREVPFILCTAALFFGFVGIYTPFFYITPYALFETGASRTLAFYLVPILNAGSVFGRLVPNAFADRIGAINTLIPSTLACALLGLAWPAVRSTGSLVTFAVLYGFFSGSFVSLPPSAHASLSSDLSKIGTRLGMSFSIAGIGLLIGSPVGGALLNLSTGHFIRAQVFCGAALMVSFALLVLTRVVHSGSAVMIKV
ncbi:major facilitator superfamily domain-containing protein [Lactifluus subvellereus]|nr:major facilitator superfamily domain-containing protein [Lactifluus subvellereus]